MVSKDEWGDCMPVYQAAITDGGLFTDTGVGLDERGENERPSEHDYEMKTVC